MLVWSDHQCIEQIVENEAEKAREGPNVKGLYAFLLMYLLCMSVM